jgi:eukaryotic-like serine/threonine-protein kinase
MKPEHWQRIKALLQSALDHNPAERAAFLDEACGGDAHLRNEVESLIVSHGRATSFIETPAFEVMAESIENSIRESLVGDTLGHYHIIGQLGAGGMGEVYLAEETKLGRKVALKLLPAYFTRDDERVRRFQQEARAVSALNHPNILTIYEIGQIDSRHFIATEFIDGETLRERMTKPELKFGETLDVAIQVTSALCAAHEAGVVHRDIKPENIMLRRDGYVKVLDFGLAKLTEREPTAVATQAPSGALIYTDPGVVMGTVSYMSPDQARGLAIDAQTDIWSLGVVLYEMVGGRVPFAGATSSDVIASILEREPPPLAQLSPSVPTDLLDIVAKALRKDKEQRYQKASDLLLDLTRLKQDLEFDAKLEQSGRTDLSSGAVRRSGGTAAAETTAGAEQAEASTSGTQLSGNEVRRRSAAVAVITLLLTSLVIGLFYFRNSDKSKEVPRGTQVSSIAVLPFKSLSTDGSEYLGLGMADTLIAKLSNLRQIIVRPTGAVRQYTAPNQDPLAAGREQRVDAVLDGSIQKSGDKVRVTVRLLSVADGATLWATQFDQNFTEIFAMQDSISERVAGALALELTGEERMLLTKRHTENTEAYQLYLKGRFFLNKRTKEGISKAAEYFNQAVELDPNDALTYLALADCYNISIYFTLTPPRELIPKARAMAKKALEIDPSLGEAHALLSILADAEWDWNEALKEGQLAISLSPGSARVHHLFAYTVAKQGRFDEALAEIRKARDLDPLNLIINADIAEILSYAGRYDEAIEQCRITLELDPNFSLAHARLGVAYWGKGMYKEALGPLQKAVELEGEGSVRMIHLAMGYGFAGEKEKAQEFLRKLRRRAKTEYVDPTWMAVLFAATGDKDKALDWIEKAYDERSPTATALLVDPRFNTLRSEPRYQAVLRRMGLAP